MPSKCNISIYKSSKNWKTKS